MQIDFSTLITKATQKQEMDDQRNQGRASGFFGFSFLVSEIDIKYNQMQWPNELSVHPPPFMVGHGIQTPGFKPWQSQTKDLNIDMIPSYPMQFK